MMRGWPGIGVLIVALLAGCSATEDPSDGGISGTGIMGVGVNMGAITATGSIHVNGIALETDAATEVLIDGQSATENDLRVGQVVRVQADFDSALAERIEYEAAVRGPIETLTIVNPETDWVRLTVMGQPAVSLASTQFEGIANAQSLQVGDVIELSGERNSNGEIAASWIADRSAATSYRARGTVASLTTSAFEIDGLLVDYSSADTSLLPNGVLQDGELVSVVADATSYSDTPPTLVASQIVPGLALNASTGDAVSVQGFVTAFGSPADFNVASQAVDASNAAFANGTIDDLTPGARVEIEGEVDAGDTLIASRVFVRDDSFVRIHATLDSVNPGARTLELLGLSIEVSTKVDIEDDRNGGGNLALESLTAGMWVELRGYLEDDRIVASRIEIEDPDSRVIVMAPVEAFDEGAGTLQLLGTNFVARMSDGTVFEDEADGALSETEFYGALMSGTLVKIRWDPFVSIDEPVDQASLEEEL